MTLDLFTPRAPAATPPAAPSILSLDEIEAQLRTHRTVTVAGATITLRPVTSAEDHGAFLRGDIGVLLTWEGKTWNAGSAAWTSANPRTFDEAVVRALRLSCVQPWFQRAELLGPADPATLPGEWAEDGERFGYVERAVNDTFPDCADGVWVACSTYDGTKPARVHVECQASRPDWSRAQFNAVRVVADIATARAFALRWIPLARAFVAERVTAENCPVRKWHEVECRECGWEADDVRERTRRGR